MRAISYKAFFIILVSAVILGIFSFLFGTLTTESISHNYWGRVEIFQSQLQNLKTSFSAFGMSDETRKVIDTFINSIPDSVRSNCNIVITADDGKIIYKTNDNYIQANLSNINLAWDYNHAFIQDKVTGKKTWFVVSRFDEGTFPYSDQISDDSKSEQIGEINDSENIDEMFDAINYQATSGDFVTPLGISFNGIKYHILWFRSRDVDDAVYDSLGRSDSRIYGYFTAVGVLLILLYWLLVPVWVFLDARRRHTQPLPWALLVLLTNVVGLAVYWIVQSQNAKTPPETVCPACGKPVQKGYPYCPWCAKPLVKTCKGCGKALEKDWVACPWCGKRMDEE
jgi:hypothetical protein